MSPFVSLLPTLKIKERLIERLEERLHGMLTSLYDFEDRIYFDGTHYLLEQPEFKDIEKIGAVLRMLEKKKRLLELLEREATVFCCWSSSRSIEFPGIIRRFSTTITQAACLGHESLPGDR